MYQGLSLKNCEEIFRRFEPVVGVRGFQIAPPKRTPENRRSRNSGCFPAAHIVHAVPDEQSPFRLGPELSQGLQNRFRMRLGIHHVISTDQDVEVIRDTRQLEPPDRSRPVLAGHQPGLETRILHPSDQLGCPDIGNHLGIVMGQVVVAVGRNHLLHLFRLLGQVGQHHPERGADTSQPLLVGAGGQAVGLDSVVIAVKNQPDGVDQRAVEIEEEGTKATTPSSAL
jgi:hypothetical protein